MNIGIDIGGVLSKYPEYFKTLMSTLWNNEWGGYNIFIITDQHPKEEVEEVLRLNELDKVCGYSVYCADYEKYGNMAKAVILRDLKIDIFIDDFDGYLQWDSSFGPQPLMLKVMPDAYKPYWSDNWKTKDKSDFGRRKFTDA